MNFVKKNIITLTGILVGITGGYFYWKFVGCTDGSCPLKSNWMIMISYGALIGYFIGSILNGQFIKKQKES